MPRLSRFAALLATLLCVLGCDPASERGVAELVSDSKPLAAVSPQPHIEADTVRGKRLVLEFECGRCHDGTPGVAASIPLEKHCVHCHRDIASGKFRAAAGKLAEWRPHVDAYTAVPSLTAIGARFEAAWVERYLLEPRDLRPHLAPTMPRLALCAEDARDIAGYLTEGRSTPSKPAVEGDATLGERLYRDKGCSSCHEFSGAAVSAAAPESAAASGRDGLAAYRLAPDLRYTRERFRPGALGSWLEAPHAVKSDTPMPSFGLTRAEANGLGVYISTTRLEEPPGRSRPERLPRLSRRVRFAEVDEKVFSVTCRHCHSDPEKAGGDGGPGSSGGFGFRARKIDLSSYAGVSSGQLDRSGQRRSLFEPAADGTPLLVAALLARIDEDMGRENPGVRGMPLGLPPLSLEDIRLVETWISQGRPM